MRRNLTTEPPMMMMMMMIIKHFCPFLKSYLLLRNIEKNHALSSLKFEIYTEVPSTSSGSSANKVQLVNTSHC